MSDPDPLLALEAENRRLRQEADFLSRKLNERSVTYRERCDELDAAEARVAVLEAALRRIRGWDMLDATVDGRYWKGVLDEALRPEGSPAPEGQ